MTALTPEVINTDLTIDEQKLLDQCEHTIDRNMSSVFEFGLALLTITKKKLYRKTHDRVEEYMRDRFGLAKSTYYQYRGIGQFMEKVRDCGVKQLPANEFQVRPVLKLDEDAWTDVWNRIVETAPQGKVTGRHASHVVANLLGEQIKNKVDAQQKAIRQSAVLPDDIKNLVWNLLEAVRKADSDHMQKAVRDELKTRIQSILNLLED